MYEPAEDSNLLAEVIREHANGTVLDVGTGSGVLADTAVEMGLDVVAIDKDESVVAALQEKPYRVFASDRFSNVAGKFDTIICNPPYLPDDSEINDIALHGGKHGYEYIVSVIADVGNFIAPGGQFLFLISTLTKPVVVEAALAEHGLRWEIVRSQPLFMETLLVYRAWLILGEPAELIGKGARSLVYKTREGAVKISTPQRAAKEAQLLQKVNEHGIGPRFIRVEEEKLTMELINGIPFNEFLLQDRNYDVIKELLRQARVLDTIGILKQELARPTKNIIVTESKKVILLDFERSIFSERAGNVTQLAGYLAHTLELDIAIVAKQAKIYKDEPTDENYDLLIRVLFT